ncbi:MAG: general secretion pathway protein GspK [Sphingorhabdus sp.]|uniref:general secretion pathway protein GspK n=1 Tax=Sphingorhabdus sp. TaxID=1902408 RepID=UPI0038FCCA7E
MTPPDSEQGYAMVAAVAGIAVFALMALALVQANQNEIVLVNAEVGQAKAAAAADAGLAIALNGLLVKDRANRWSIDGRTRTANFDGARLQIRIEDERGKVPINLLDDELAARLMEAIGLGYGGSARTAADSLVDWIDDDEEPRPDGAEVEFYQSRGIRPRNGPLQSIDELATIRGFNPEMVKKLKPFVTVNFGTGGFDARYAHPRAIGVMLDGGADSPAAINRQRELDGQRTAIELGDAVDLVGRPLTITTEAVRPDGARSKRQVIVELTGADARPYIIRAFE